MEVGCRVDGDFGARVEEIEMCMIGVQRFYIKASDRNHTREVMDSFLSYVRICRNWKALRALRVV